MVRGDGSGMERRRREKKNESWRRSRPGEFIGGASERVYDGLDWTLCGHARRERMRDIMRHHTTPVRSLTGYGTYSKLSMLLLPR